MKITISLRLYQFLTLEEVLEKSVTSLEYSLLETFGVRLLLFQKTRGLSENFSSTDSMQEIELLVIPSETFY